MDNPTLAGHRQRLRNRFLNGGLDGFLDYEIIELLLGLGTPRKDCKNVAKDALKKFGSLKNVLEANANDLEKIHGIGRNNIFGLKLTQAVSRKYLSDKVLGEDFVKASSDVIKYLTHVLRDKDKEQFLVIFLNGQNQIIEMEILFSGTLTSSAVYPREIIKKTISNNAAAVVFVHNHPSGNPKPSREDINITRKLASAMESIDAAVHDHIIIAGNKHYSMADNGIL